MSFTQRTNELDRRHFDYLVLILVYVGLSGLELSWRKGGLWGGGFSERVSEGWLKVRRRSSLSFSKMGLSHEILKWNTY